MAYNLALKYDQLVQQSAKMNITYQGGNEVYAVSVISVVHLDLAGDALVPAGVDRRLKSVGVIKVLHCF